MRKGSKRSFVAPQAKTNAEINVTPLVDVVLVLLIIFMVVTPLMEENISVRIPTEQAVNDTTAQPKEQIVVSLAESGELRVNAQVVEPVEYRAVLTEILAKRPLEDRVVFISAEDRAAYQKLVFAMDGARQAGAQTLGFAPTK